MRTHYDKLVRDNIPAIIEQSGRTCAVEPLDDQQFRAALLAKLVEEATEAAEAVPESLLAELADVDEVLDATLAAHGLTRAQLDAERARRRSERGAFTNRLRLVWTDDAR